MDERKKADKRFGNSFWKARAKSGRDKIFSTPADLWRGCCEYFQWIEDNPLYETKLVTYRGHSELEDLPKLRAMTIQGLSIFLGVVVDTWAQYRKLKEFSAVCKAAENVMYEQKLSGAMSGMLNPAIVARHLGLADKTDNEHSGKDGGPIQTVVMDKDQYAATRKKMIDGDDC